MAGSSAKRRVDQDVQAVVARARRGNAWSVIAEAVDVMLRDALPIDDGVRLQIVDAVRASQATEAIAEAVGRRPSLISAKDLFDDARLRSQARGQILSGYRMLSAEEAGRFLGSTSTTKPSQYAHDARKRGDLLGLPDRNTYVFPVFQLDLKRKVVRAAAARVNRMLNAASDPWGVASWWTNPSDRADGKTPIDLLEENDVERLELLAKLEATPLDP
ncbi:hypothetical protein EON77_05730 [bacterium]|nr:MAG: hypothetical protein EON77_05730 [bacterium]